VAGEELAPVRTRKREHVLDVGDGGADRADDGRVERPARGREEPEAREAAQRLEATRRNVLVRDGVAEGVRDEPEHEGGASGAGENADEPTCGDVERNDHERRIAAAGSSKIA
jgi:hypothetical protein